MVLNGRLQLLPLTKRTEGTVEHLGGHKKTLPATHTGDGCEPNRLHLDGS
jgi:hypothetical protein